MKIIDEKRKMNERVNVLWLIYIYIYIYIKGGTIWPQLYLRFWIPKGYW